MVQGDYKKSKEHIKKISLFRKGKTYEELYGKKRAKLIKKKIGIAMLGREVPLELRKRINESEKGKFVSKETKEKIRLSKIGELNSMFGRKQSKKWHEMRKNMVLPKKDSTIEVKIQNFLKQLGIEFFTHQYMKIEQGYQCDILVPSKNLVIECDGIYWHKYPIGRKRDIIRTQELLDKGFKVLRFWESEIRVITLPEFKNKLEVINS